MAESGIAIIKTGAITPVGIGAAQTAASVRAGIARTSESSIYDKNFDPFVMAILPDDVLPPLEQDLEQITGLTARQTRMLRLAAPALQEVLEDIPQQEQIPLYLGVPEAFPDRPNPVHDAFIEHLCVQTGIQVNIENSRLLPKGRAAGLIALNEAIKDILSGTHKYIIVGGVDTYVDLYLLGTLDMEGRILGPRVMDGFIPGEGAGFLLLTGDENARADKLPPLAMLSQASTGYEEGHLYSDQPYKGDGLGATLEQLFQKNEFSEPIKYIYSSMNGENHWAKEWGVAYLRNSQSIDDEYDMRHPAEYYGDTGAASGILMIVLSATAISNGYQTGPSLITCSSDFGGRAAVAVTPFEGGK